MRITANHVTLLRLVLLPLPVALIYHGGQAWRLGALALYVLLGFTDAVDGMLARRHGTTRLGELLDPVADKIFIVAAYGPLADFQVVPLWMVVALFVRELAVTALRSISIDERLRFRTSRIAKLKTGVQMGGAGFILLLWLFPAPATVLPALWAGVALAAIPSLAALVRQRRPGWVAEWSLLLVTTLAAVRSLTGSGATILVITAVAVGLTMVSGAEYAWGMRRVLALRFRRQPVEGLRLLGLSLVVPVLYLPALAWAEAPSFTVLLVLAAELGAGGLDNSLVQAGLGRGPRPDLLRSVTQALLGAGLLYGLVSAADPLLAHGLGIVALLLTLGDVLARLIAHPEAFRRAAQPGHAS